MLSRILIGLVSAAGAAVIGVPGAAWADPAPAPELPNINGYAAAKPSEYSVMDNRYYAFATPDGLTCAFDRTNGSYGCSGALPAAPGEANLVSGASRGAPGFANAANPIFAAIGAVKPLPPMTRLSFRNVTCGVDGAGTTTCTNAQDQTGFVLTPAGSFIVGA
ncbi:MAG: hypothetical protein JWR37_1848 [Mycobacterium sp.]|nr:hypothetical protein [Mycobacterium sp.]